MANFSLALCKTLKPWSFSIEWLASSLSFLSEITSPVPELHCSSLHSFYLQVRYAKHCQYRNHSINLILQECFQCTFSSPTQAGNVKQSFFQMTPAEDSCIHKQKWPWTFLRTTHLTFIPDCLHKETRLAARPCAALGGSTKHELRSSLFA